MHYIFYNSVIRIHLNNAVELNIKHGIDENIKQCRGKNATLHHTCLNLTGSALGFIGLNNLQPIFKIYFVSSSPLTPTFYIIDNI
jgi:hypothetical protein